MTGITGITAQRRRRASFAAAVVVTSSFFLGGLAGSAKAGERDRDWREYQRPGYHHHRDWDRGYYRAPPVVYDRPYYAPPVVYGPGWGLNFNFR